MVYYWDTSALLSLLLQESTTQKLQKFAKKEALPGYTSFFSLIEMESAFQRRLTAGEINNASLLTLRLQAQQLESALGLIWSDPTILEGGRQCVLKYGLRPGDALQLASAELLQKNKQAVFFVCLDQKLNQTAKAYRFQTLNLGMMMG